MAVEQYNLVTGDWLGLGYIINDLATRVVGQVVAPGSSPSFAGATLSGFTQGSVLFTGASGVISEDNSNLFWDDANNRLGIGTATPTQALDVAGKIAVGSFSSPIDVTATREYGLEIHYSGDDYNATAIRARAHAVTSDTSAQFQGGLFQAANNDGIDVGILNGLVAEAIGKATANAATIGTMRGALIGAEWSAFDTVTQLNTLHIRIHSRDNAGAGSFGTGYGIYLENEAVGGNGQALDAGIYFKGTNLSAGNKAFTYGIDFSGATFATAEIRLSNGETISNLVDGVIKLSGGGLWVDGTTGDTPTSGAGARLMWIPAKRAFRAGEVTGAQWDAGNIGNYSVAFGYSGTASGDYSTHFGSSGTTSGIRSIHFGSFGTVSGVDAIHFGFSGTASGTYSTHFGSDGEASGNYSIHFGSLGVASGDYSTHFGKWGLAESYFDTVFGRHNVGGGTADSWVATDPLLEIGIGADVSHRANALTVLKNGNFDFHSGNLGTLGTLGAGATTLDSLVVDSPTLVVNATSYEDRVGIGTAIPDETLEVVGNIAVTGIAGDDVYIFNNAGSGIRIRSDSLTTQWWAGNDGPAYFGTVSNDDLHIQTNNNTRITILSGAGSGYVGIGVTDPDAKLEVVGTLHISGAATFDSTLGAGAITGTSLTLSGDIIGEQSDEIRNETVGEWRMKPASGGLMRLRMSGTNPSLNIGGGDVFSWVSPNDYIRVIAGGAKHYYIFSTSADGINKEVRVYGFPTGESLKYGQFQMVSGTTTPRFQISTDGEAISIPEVTYIGDGGTTDYSEFEADGTLKFNGAATVFNDLVLPLDSARVPASNAPSWESFVGNLNAFAYQVNDFQEFTAELIHGYKEGSDISFHIHGALNALTAQEEKVQFEIEYSIADANTSTGLGDVFPDGSGSLLTAELVVPTATADLTHIFITVGVDNAGTFGIDATIKGRIRRIAKSAGGNELTGNIFVTQVGVHYEIDTVGSRAITTK